MVVVVAVLLAGVLVVGLLVEGAVEEGPAVELLLLLLCRFPTGLAPPGADTLLTKAWGGVAPFRGGMGRAIFFAGIAPAELPPPNLELASNGGELGSPCCWLLG